jgi:hypothetical protein
MSPSAAASTVFEKGRFASPRTALDVAKRQSVLYV